MFRIFKVVAISLFFSGAAFAHDDWGHRYRPHHHHHHRHGFNSYYRPYAPPMMRYHPEPIRYYMEPPVRAYGYLPPMPRHEHHHRGDW